MADSASLKEIESFINKWLFAIQHEMKAKIDFMTGREEGMHEGLQVGRYEGKREVARKMLIDGMSLFSIRKFTVLKECDIRAIQS